MANVLPIEKKVTAISMLCEGASIALHYGYYNLVKMHKSIRCTPAMAAGVVSSPWTVRDLVEMIEA